MIPAYLLSKSECEKKIDVCHGSCIEPVKKAENGRWYITMGHPGFNSDANNGAGYATRGKALGVLRFYSRK